MASQELPAFDSQGVRWTQSNRALIRLVDERLPREEMDPAADPEAGHHRNDDRYAGPPCTECGHRMYKAQATDSRVQAWCTECLTEYRREVREVSVARPGSRYPRAVSKTTWSQRSPIEARRRFLERHPQPEGLEFFAYSEVGPLNISISGPHASIARTWPTEHRIYDVVDVRRAPFAPTRNVYGWFLRSPVPGVDVRGILDEIERREEEFDGDISQVVAEVLEDAANGVEMQPSSHRLGELWRAALDPASAQSELTLSSRYVRSRKRLELDVAVADTMHRIVRVDGKNTAVDHRGRKTSRGVPEEVCAACHRVLVGLERFGRADPRKIHEWVEAGIDLAEAAEWYEFATPQERLEWLAVGFSSKAAAAWASTCGPAEAVARAEEGEQPY